MVPWRLPKRGEGNPVPAEQPRVRVRSRMDMGEELRLEEPLLGPHRLKGSDAAEHFASVAPGHPHGGDLARLLIDVQVWRTADVDASVGEIHTALGIVGKAREEFFAHRYHVVGLPTRASHSPRQQDILAVAEHPPEGVTGKRSRRRLLPRHDHPGVQSPCEGHSDALPTIEIPREVPREDLADFLIIGFRPQRVLLLPLPRQEVGAFALDCAATKNPGRSRR